MLNAVSWDELSKETVSDELSQESGADELSQEYVSDELSQESVSDELSQESVSDELSQESVSDELSQESVADALPQEPVSDKAVWNQQRNKWKVWMLFWIYGSKIIEAERGCRFYDEKSLRHSLFFCLHFQ